MKKCKITVLKTEFYEDLAKEYGSEGIGPCPAHKVGDVFYGDWAKPDHFCDEAWKAIHHYVFALSHDSNVIFDGGWVDKPGIAICSCNDGIRPVIFKIESLDEE